MMDYNAKPYRLLGTMDWQRLESHVSQLFKQWNQEYTTLSLNYSHHLTEAPAANDCFLHFYSENQVIACAEPSFLMLLQQAHFNHFATCFATSNQHLCELFLQKILNTQSISMQEEYFQSSSWIYPGSPYLALKIRVLDQSCFFYFHPTWVLSFLHCPKPVNHKKETLQSALEKERFDAFISLPPLSLSLKQLAQLQPGDIVKTEHPLTQAITLRSRTSSICEVDLGASDIYKSIKIRGN